MTKVSNVMDGCFTRRGLMVVLVVISLSIQSAKTRARAVRRRSSDFAVPTDEGAGAVAAVQRFSGTREFDEDEEEECEEERRAHRVFASSLSSSSSVFFLSELKF